MSEGVVTLEIAGAIATVTFDRPQERNAMTWAMYGQLGVICERLPFRRPYHTPLFEPWMGPFREFFRAVEWDGLIARWRSTASGVPHLILLAGEAGIGKTRLVAELTGRARTGGATILSGGCIDLVAGSFSSDSRP